MKGESMKKRVLMSLITASAVLGINSAMAEGNIAVVDMQAVVAKSAQVQALNREQQVKMQELDKWLGVAQADIEKQKTPEGKEKLLKKYNADFAKKKEAIAKNYQTKLQAIDKSISDTIANEAKTKGFDMVLPKSIVIYGGTNITQDIMKVVK